MFLQKRLMPVFLQITFHSRKCLTFAPEIFHTKRFLLKKKWKDLTLDISMNLKDGCQG